MLTIGGVSDTFSSTTIPAKDTTPDAFTFTDQTNVALSTLVTSNEITVTGINAATAITVTGGKYSINNGAFTTAAGTVKNGDKVKVQHTSSASYATKIDTVLTIGGVSDTFSSTTKADPNTPPTANAGSNQVVKAGTKVTLNGSGTDANGDPLSYKWTQTMGTPVILAGANMATTSFIAPNVTVDITLSFTLTVSDGKGGTATDSVVVVVEKPPVQAIISNLDAGDAHTCAVVEGGVKCWGDNNYHQLGNGMGNIIHETPVQTILAGSGVTAVAAGGTHTCAVVSGGVKCWGNNSVGQVGNSDSNSYYTPVQAIAAGSDVTSVDAGSAHSCAVVKGGVQCWGDNSFGEVGDGTTTERLSPVQTIPVNSGVTAVAVASFYTCAVVSGGVKCWGLNGNGQLGDGTTIWRSRPVQVIPAGSGVTAVAASSIHTCAVVNGGVKCWGSNYYGQLGDGTTIDHLTPVQIISAGSGVTAIAVSGYHSCAVVSGGVKCWGRNSEGQLGDGSTTQQLTPRQAIPTGSGANSVTAGSYYTCALVVGKIKCWGWNDSGQFGNGTTDSSYTPVDGPFFPASTTDNTPNPFTFTDQTNVALSAVVTSSEIKVSGLNTPSTITVVGGKYSINGGSYTNTVGIVNNDDTVKVQHTSSASYATKTDTTLTIGGVSDTFTSTTVAKDTTPNAFSFTDQTGVALSTVVTSNEITITGINVATPISVSNGKYSLNGGAYTGTAGTVKSGDKVKVQQTSSASYSTKIDTVLTIGGISDTFSSTTRATPMNIPPTANAGVDQIVNTGTKVTLSGSGTDANGDPLSYKWTQTTGTPVTLAGANMATTSFTAPNVTVDTTLSFTLTVSDGRGGMASDSVVIVVKKVSSQTGVTGLAAGSSHTCVIVNGGVQCWGDNSYGELGDGTVIERHTPVQAIPAGSGVTAIAAGQVHTCAVVNSGVKCWGFNGNGQLGDNSTTNRLIPTQAIASGSGVTAITAAQHHTCVVVKGGVQCWGSNAFGELGDGSSTDSLKPVQTIPAGSGVTAVSVGAYHGCAVINGGTRCWGYNYDGQLGDDSMTNRFTPVQTIAAGGGVIAVAAGEMHTCAVVSGGVKCWGNNFYGELGDGTSSTHLTPVQTIPIGSGVTAITANWFHTCAVMNVGVKCWGINNFGQLGDGTITDRFSPVQTILAGSGVTTVVAGSSHTCALVTGKVKCWGANFSGQFGNGTTDSSYTPVDGPSFSTN